MLVATKDLLGCEGVSFTMSSKDHFLIKYTTKNHDYYFITIKEHRVYYEKCYVEIANPKSSFGRFIKRVGHCLFCGIEFILHPDFGIHPVCFSKNPLLRWYFNKFEHDLLFILRWGCILYIHKGMSIYQKDVREEFNKMIAELVESEEYEKIKKVKKQLTRVPNK